MLAVILAANYAKDGQAGLRSCSAGLFSWNPQPPEKEFAGSFFSLALFFAVFAITYVGLCAVGMRRWHYMHGLSAGT